ncbi:hypothetical protein AB0I28_32795 [Phytomonospora sp. NPDC050363]|uniref:hypothetical protein n=1 Tax=Phytomonospora sp. NPDC050363 TaxID=3155642 RepID=UPI00341072BF
MTDHDGEPVTPGQRNAWLAERGRAALAAHHALRNPKGQRLDTGDARALAAAAVALWRDVQHALLEAHESPATIEDEVFTAVRSDEASEADAIARGEAHHTCPGEGCGVTSDQPRLRWMRCPNCQTRDRQHGQPHRTQDDHDAWCPTCQLYYRNGLFIPRHLLERRLQAVIACTELDDFKHDWPPREVMDAVADHAAASGFTRGAARRPQTTKPEADA